MSSITTSKNQSGFICDVCEGYFSKWTGQCPECGRFNTLVSTEPPPDSPPDGGVYRIADDLVKQPQFDVWIQGALVKVQKPGFKETPKGGGKRDEVGPFNRTQRLRALRALAKTDQEADSNFYTLTYSDTYAKSVCVDLISPKNAGRKVKRDLDVLNKRLRRQYPGIGAFWRVETIDRKSGKHVGLVFPHIHGFFWGVSDLQAFRDWLSLGWAEIAANGSLIDDDHVKAGVQVQEAKDWRAVMAYASKMVYAAKPGDSQLEGMGRWWGAFNREAIPWSNLESSSMSSKGAIMLYRTMRKYLERATNKPVKLQGNSLTMFTDNPGDWHRLANYYSAA